MVPAIADLIGTAPAVRMAARKGKGRHVMDLHRIPDDLSIPKFLRRESRLPTPAEMDDMCGRAFLEVFRELNEKERKKGERPK
jgi:hypothetical protein